MIVRDEEANLPACVKSVADLVNEIIVVDTGSTDHTCEVAASLGARLFHFPWSDDFAAARNESIRCATGQWIFWLDADDRMDEGNRKKMRILLNALKENNIAYMMKCVSDSATNAASATGHARLFRNLPEIRWQFRVHEQIVPAVIRLGGEVRWSDVAIQHVGYENPVLQKRKLERNLRLLQLEDEKRIDPFTQFNLGWTYLVLGRAAEAVPFLIRSLRLSKPGTAHAPLQKIYALLVQAYRQLLEKNAALVTCREGRSYFPDDAELLYEEGMILREQGDFAAAERCLIQLLQMKPQSHETAKEEGLHGYRTRHELALLYCQQGRATEAETQWRSVLLDRPDCMPACIGLVDLYLAKGRWEQVDQLVERLEAEPGREMESAVVRARMHMARKEFDAARRILEEAIARNPQVLWPRIILSHALLQEGRSWAEAERALREVLALDPSNVEARHNLVVLLKKLGRGAEVSNKTGV